MTRLHGAAVMIQKHIRGQLVRKKAITDMQAYMFFRKVQRIVTVRTLVYSLKNAFIHVKNTKQKYLKRYIFHAAARIQSLFRGFVARKYKVPICKKL